MRFVAPVLGTAMFVALCVGCNGRTVLDDPAQGLIYDTCFTVDDCIPEAEVCEEISTNIAGELFTNAICTLSCTTMGDNSPDCPLPFLQGVGRGSCYIGEDVGGMSTTPLCFEPCGVTGDCLRGFVCLNDQDFCGSSTSCPIDAGDSICVPGP